MADLNLDEIRAERDDFRDSALFYAAKVAELNDQIAAVRRLCDEYKDQPPPIFRGPGLSEHGIGFNAGTRTLAQAVLSTVDDALRGESDA